MNFYQGLNILSGETGSGKSIIIDSISFVLGGRASKDFVRNGESTAVVELILSINEESILKGLQNIGIELDDEYKLIMYRSINLSSKSICRVNGRAVTVSILKEISKLLIDMHSQHSHQNLLDASKHVELLDAFCGEKLSNLKILLQDNLKIYKDIKKQIDEINSEDKAQRIDFLRFQIEEIRSVNLQIGEEDVLHERKKILNHTERLKKYIHDILHMLYENNTDTLSASDQISKSLALIENVAELDISQSNLIENLNTVDVLLSDTIIQLRAYAENINSNYDEIDEVEERLNLIYNLKRKYGNSIDDILQFCESQEKTLHLILNSEEQLKLLSDQIQAIESELLEICDKITEIRNVAAKKIKNGITEILRDLGMKYAQFDVLIQKKSEITAIGNDKVEFMISANEGEPIKQLSKIASGGEMSRVMLALKTILADSDSIETFIFDEIDTGISGRTAQKVAEKLRLISRNHQIICITHLPQIASMADHHYIIEKKSTKNKTTSTVTELDEQNTIQELARLIGGAKITESTINAAKELKLLNDL